MEADWNEVHFLTDALRVHHGHEEARTHASQHQLIVA
jgi:hypothetical protein